MIFKKKIVPYNHEINALMFHMTVIVCMSLVQLLLTFWLLQGDSVMFDWGVFLGQYFLLEIPVNGFKAEKVKACLMTKCSMSVADDQLDDANTSVQQVTGQEIWH